MSVIKIKDKIHYIGEQDWDRKLFDEIVPLPNGTSYNSYFIEGSEKNALIDTVDPEKSEDFIKNIKKLEIKKIDYIIINHAEQDHSGSLPIVLKMFPSAKIVTNAKCKGFLQDFFSFEDDTFIVVGDNDTLSLGDKTLQFILFPWVHWPETMLTYLKEDEILFSCDLFGSHLATTCPTECNENQVYLGAKRYYAEIMMPFRKIIKKNFVKIDSLSIKTIAPSHGPIYKSPNFIIKAYKNWLSDDCKNEVLIPYVSMHGSVKAMVDYLVDYLSEHNIHVRPFNLTTGDIGELAMSLVDPKTVIFGTPTFLTNAHPAMVYAAYLVSALKPKIQHVGIIGSYGWGGRTVEQLKTFLSGLDADFIDAVNIKGFPKDEDFVLLEELAKKIIDINNK